MTSVQCRLVSYGVLVSCSNRPVSGHVSSDEEYIDGGEDIRSDENIQKSRLHVSTSVVVQDV